MRKSIAALGLASVLTFGGGSYAFAQNDVVAQAEAEDEGGDDTGKWGLLGLLGLAGLAGLKRRDDDRNTHQSNNARTSTTTR